MPAVQSSNIPSPEESGREERAPGEQRWFFVVRRMEDDDEAVPPLNFHPAAAAGRRSEFHASGVDFSFQSQGLESTFQNALQVSKS